MFAVTFTLLIPHAAQQPALADGWATCNDGFQSLNSCKYESHKLVTTCFNSCQRVDLVVKWRGATANSGGCDTGSGIDSWHMHVIEVVRTSDGNVKWSGSGSSHTNGCPDAYSSPTLTLYNDHVVRMRWRHVDAQNSSYSFYTPGTSAHEMLVTVRI